MKELCSNPEDPDLLYRLGYHLVSMKRPDAAKSFLERCLLQVGNNADVLYELGFCNYLNRDFNRANEILLKAVPDLSPERAAAALFLRIECLLYADRAGEGAELLRLARKEDRANERAGTLEALALMYERYNRLERSSTPLDLRCWHFIRHGGALLAQSSAGSSRGLFENQAMNALATGALLRLLQAVMERLKIRVDAILHIGGGSNILALATGSLLKRPVREWSCRARSNEMLVIPDMQALDSAGILPIDRDECPFLFCFQLFPLLDYPVLPEIIGLMSKKFRFPWEERVELINDKKTGTRARRLEKDSCDPEITACKIADAARMLPEDKKAPQVAAFYECNNDLLVWSRKQAIARRRFFNPLPIP